MARQYYGILTTKGRALYANALLLNQDVNLSEMAIDDTVNFLPDEKLESLPSEVYRAELNSLEKDEDNDEMVIAELVIPSQRGGFYCRGFGLYTDTGILFAVGSLAETYKATEDEGSGGELVIQADIVVTNTAALVLKVDPTTVLATRETVDRAIAGHEAKLDPHPQYAPKNSPTLTGIPKAPTPAEGNNTTQIATTAFVQAIATALNTALALKAPLASPGLTGTPTAPTAAQSTNNTQIATTAFVKSAIAALVASSPAALDTLNELAAALGNDPNFATTMTNALAGKQPLDSTLTNLSGKDVAGLLSYLRLGTAAQKNAQKSISDKTSDALMLVGAFGFGGVGAESVTTDISNIYTLPIGHAGNPEPNQNYVHINLAGTSFYSSRIALSLNGTDNPRIFIKNRAGTTESNWIEVYTSRNPPNSVATLTTARKISVSGDASGYAMFNGGSDAEISVTVSDSAKGVIRLREGSVSTVGTLTTNFVSVDTGMQIRGITFTSGAQSVNVRPLQMLIGTQWVTVGLS